jgi:hypothetical protein
LINGASDIGISLQGTLNTGWHGSNIPKVSIVAAGYNQFKSVLRIRKTGTKYLHSTYIDEEETISHETEPFAHVQPQTYRPRKANMPSMANVKDTIT